MNNTASYFKGNINKHEISIGWIYVLYKQNNSDPFVRYMYYTGLGHLYTQP